MDLSVDAYIISENIGTNEKSRVKKFAPIAKEYFSKMSITEPNADDWKSLQNFCINEKGMKKSTAQNGLCSLKKYYIWEKEKENTNNMNEDIIIENNTSVNIQEEKMELKKISVNIQKKKYLQLQCLALKNDKNISEYIISAIDNLLKEYESELQNITGIF